MVLNMNWDKWSGFQGSGIYIILNRSSLYSLDLNHNDDLISLRPHTPHTPSQLWHIHKWSGGDVYVIENVHHKAVVTSKDLIPSDSFRSIKYPGYVLSQDCTGEWVILWQEEQEVANEEGEVQKWLLQKQEVDGGNEIICG
ncbi:MAG: hypothetical protein L6R38_008161 [Xanthoria sp. 2 TBL-2021]|nr:MAG: hypothetical protein L6R38_008161 [Xanthoria sp. 2 TBL-2021]